MMVEVILLVLMVSMFRLVLVKVSVLFLML